MKLYKIRHKITGLFSKGGCNPFWTKKGKTWSTLSHLKRHINSVIDYRYHKSADMQNWEVIEIEVSETLTPICTAQDIANEKINKDNQKRIQELKKQIEKELNKKIALAKLTPAERKALGYE